MKPSLKVIVRGTKVTAELTDVLTSGMVGVPVEFQFDEGWGDLRKLGVFEGSGQKKHLDLNLGGELTIPWEVLTEERTLLKVGVEWRKADGTVVIPTRWTEVGVVLPGAQAGNDPALDPSPTVYDQIMQAIDEGRLKGADGLTPYIGENGTWWLGKEDTGIKAEGKDGYTPVKGKDYFDGKAGYTPQRGVDYWTEADRQAINAHIAEEVAALGDHSTIVCEAKGETIRATDSAKAKLRGLKLCGKSEQFTTTGAQLANTTEPLQNPGIVIITGHGKRVEVKNTSAYVHAQFALSLSPNTDYVLSYKTNLVSGQYNARIIGIDGNGVETAIITSAAMPMVFNSGEYGSWKVAFYATTELSSNPVYEDIMVNPGTIAKPWEPYTGGKPSPSPEYQQNPVIPGKDGDIGVSVCGKNLVENTASTFTNNGITFTVNDDGSVTANGTSTGRATCTTCKPKTLVAGEKYILTGCPAGGTRSTYGFGYTNNVDKAYMDYGDGVGIEGFDLSTYPNAALMIEIKSGVTVSNLVFKPMVRRASVADDTYEPYKGQTLTALTPNGLPGIKVSSGGNWEDSTGQQWVCDKIDFARGVYVQRVYKETFLDFSKYTSQLVYAPKNGFTEGSVAVDKIANIGAPICDKFPFASTGDKVRFGITTGRIYFTIEGEYTKDEWISEMTRISPTVLFALGTPIETPLSAEEMAQFAELHTNYPTTTIINDEGVGMEVSYVADIQNHMYQYIDKKFNEMAAAIVAKA